MDVNHNNYINNSVFLCISVTIDRLRIDMNSHINADGILTVVVAACVNSDINSVWSGYLSVAAAVCLTCAHVAEGLILNFK